VSPEDKKEYPLAWVSNYGGTRVFGTTLGHGNDTWADPVFQDLLVRAFKWAVGRE
jgi:type 1 glutamine amidotransferase